MVKILKTESEQYLKFEMSGKLHDDDYKKFVPIVDHAIDKYKKVNLLIIFKDFKGWDFKALWDDIKFASNHCNKIQKIAIVGENKWEKFMAAVCKPFTRAQIKYFDKAGLAEADSWAEVTKTHNLQLNQEQIAIIIQALKRQQGSLRDALEFLENNKKDTGKIHKVQTDMSHIAEVIECIEGAVNA